ncbi:MAG: hypothetical protein WAL30_06010 [Candidatus Aquirickettsiella sp.]
MAKNFNNQINFGKILSLKPFISEYSIIFNPIEVYRIKNAEKDLIKVGDTVTVSDESCLAKNCLESYEKAIELKYADNYTKQCAEKNSSYLMQDDVRLQRLRRNEKNDEITISSETKHWELAEYCIHFIKRDKQAIEVSSTLIPGRKNFQDVKKSFDTLKSNLENHEPIARNVLLILSVPSEFISVLENSVSDKSSQRPISPSSSASLEFISSQSSVEEKHDDTQQVKPHKPQSQIPRLIRNALPRIFKLNENERLVILSEDHEFLQKISPVRQKHAPSHWKAIRIDNLTASELKELNKYNVKAIAVGRSNSRA